MWKSLALPNACTAWQISSRKRWSPTSRVGMPYPMPTYEAAHNVSSCLFQKISQVQKIAFQSLVQAIQPGVSQISTHQSRLAADLGHPLPQHPDHRPRKLAVRPATGSGSASRSSMEDRIKLLAARAKKAAQGGHLSPEMWVPSPVRLSLCIRCCLRLTN